jgi:hypothetical protein
MSAWHHSSPFTQEQRFGRPRKRRYAKPLLRKTLHQNFPQPNRKFEFEGFTGGELTSNGGQVAIGAAKMRSDRASYSKAAIVCDVKIYSFSFRERLNFCAAYQF